MESKVDCLLWIRKALAMEKSLLESANKSNSKKVVDGKLKIIRELERQGYIIRGEHFKAYIGLNKLTGKTKPNCGDEGPGSYLLRK